MKATIKIAKIKGIEIGLHYSWVIIAFLISFSLSGYFAETHPEWDKTLTAAMGIITALLFFSAIIIHELSHAAVAKRNGLPVRAITLFALGGVAQIEKEPEDAKTEFLLGIIGPFTSMVIGFISLGFARLSGWIPFNEPDTPLKAILVWLGYVNFALAVFNMIPGFPMDGGRVFRSLIWAVTGNADQAAKTSSLLGQFLATGMVIFGIILFFNGIGFGGLWIAFIGWFLLNSAKAEYFHAEITKDLRGVKVENLMITDFPVLEKDISLQSVVDDYLLRTRERCFMVAENGNPIGMITPHEISKFERSLWKIKTVSEAMRPFETLHTVSPQMPVVEALEIIGRENVNQLPVIENGFLVGIISRDQIINYLFTRKELNL